MNKQPVEDIIREGVTRRQVDYLLLEQMRELKEQIEKLEVKLDNHVKVSQEYFLKIDRMDLERKVGFGLIATTGIVVAWIVDHYIDFVRFLGGK